MQTKNNKLSGASWAWFQPVLLSKYPHIILVNLPIKFVENLKGKKDDIKKINLAKVESGPGVQLLWVETKHKQRSAIRQ